MATYPYEFEPLDEETNNAIKRDFKGFTRGLGRLRPSDLCLPPEFKNYGERIFNMEVRPDDIWIVNFPKSDDKLFCPLGLVGNATGFNYIVGTTWAQAIIWAILNEGKIETLEGDTVLNAWRFIEMDAALKDGMDHLISKGLKIPESVSTKAGSHQNQFEKAINQPRDQRRLIKTHLPFPFLPPNLLDTAKVVYIVRNPKDVCVSFFNHEQNVLAEDFQGDFKQYFDYFIKDVVLYCPYWPHVIDAWTRRHHPNMLFLYYEEMKKDFLGSLRKFADFLEKPTSEEILQKLVVELSVEHMKKNPSLNREEMKEMGIMKKDGHFIRKGIVGDWKNYFTPEMEKEMEEWSRRQRQGSDFKLAGE